MIVFVLMVITRILLEFVKFVIQYVRHVTYHQLIVYLAKIILIDLFRMDLVFVITHIMMMVHLFVLLVLIPVKIVRLEEYV